ncbi:MAG: polyprenol monophosphomannose synthase [Candidatus Woesearchaeota archaeon]|jgi:dolichol-phosphate mannosyltransferase
MKITIVIPTYNEAENIKKIIVGIADTLKYTEYHKKYCILIVDDESPDNTGNIAEELGKKYPVKVIHRKAKRGYGEACKEGFKQAITNSDIIMTMDCDLSHDPIVIPFFIRKIEEGYDMVIGSRYILGGKIQNWSTMRRLMSKSANFFTKFLLRLPVSDCTSGYRAYKKEVLATVNLENIFADGYSFLEELLYATFQAGYKITEIPIVFIERQYGASKLSKKEMIKFIMTLIRLKRGNYAK